VTDGACSGTHLITACGTWNRPVGSTTGAIHVFGKLYDGVTPDPQPPADAVEGTAIDNAGTRTWHFNAAPLPGAAIGSSRTLMVWVTADDVAFFDPSTPQTFMCCDAASGGCPSAPCGEVSAPAPTACAELTVITSIAPRSYLLEPDDTLVHLATAIPGGGKFNFPRIVLEHDLDQSTSERAVWAARERDNNVKLHLEITRTACGNLCAELTLQRILPAGVSAPLRWEAMTFDLLAGGKLVSTVGGTPLGSVLNVRPERPAQRKALARKAKPVPRAKKR
jgi:hypothetical protein